MTCRPALVALALCGCTRLNPAFEDGGADEQGGESADTLVDEGSGTDATTSAEATTSSEATTGADATTSADATDATDETTSASTTDLDTSSETGITCEPGQLACDGACIDPDTNAEYCGSCETSCNEGESCVGGSCVVDKIIFVSSVPHTGGFADGINGVDAFCQDLAGQVGLPGEFLAWNSTAQSTPNLDFDESGRYVRPDKVVVADSYAELVGGVRYFSWSGTRALTNAFDVSDAMLGLTSLVYDGHTLEAVLYTEPSADLLERSTKGVGA